MMHVNVHNWVVIEAADLETLAKVEEKNWELIEIEAKGNWQEQDGIFQEPCVGC